MCVCVCECVQVIACAFRGEIASIGVSLLGMAHPLWENISSVGYRWTALIRGREVEESRPVASIVLFIKLWKELVLAYACVCNRVLIKLTLIIFENNIKSLLNVAKRILVNGIRQCGTETHDIHRKF